MGTTRRNIKDWPTTNLPEPILAKLRTKRVINQAAARRIYFQDTNRSPDAEHKSLHWTCTTPAVLELLQETFGRKAICTLSLSFLAARRFIFKKEKKKIRYQNTTAAQRVCQTMSKAYYLYNKSETITHLHYILTNNGNSEHVPNGRCLNPAHSPQGEIRVNKKKGFCST